MLFSTIIYYIALKMMFLEHIPKYYVQKYSQVLFLNCCITVFQLLLSKQFPKAFSKCS